MSEQNDSPVLIMFTRLEAKLDVALAQHGAKIDQHGSDLADHETRIRNVEARPQVSPDTVSDHETRIRDVEKRRFVSWKALAAVLAACVTLLGAATPIVDKIYGG